MCTPVTSPSTRVLPSPSRVTICVRRHSSAAGAPATRAQAMVVHSARVSPAWSNSDWWAGSVLDEAFIASRMANSTIFTQNTPVSMILATESLVPSRSGLVPVEANITCGGV